MPNTLLSRFLRYVRIYTDSDPVSTTYPSSARQWDLLRLLEAELIEMGADDVGVNEFGYVLATIPPTTTKTTVPTVAFLAHVDTAPDFPGKDVKPIVHKKYAGKAIRLPDDKNQVLDPTIYPELLEAVSKDIVTGSGTTLLGADDKAGVAIVMTLADYLLRHPTIKHGPIRICFTPDEEVGRGVEHLDLNELGANVAYTIDGGGTGEVAWESFSADEAVVTIEGVSTHPGEAKKKGMVNAVHLAARLLAALPREDMAPESTEDRQGYLHPNRIQGNTARVELHFILRDFSLEGLADKGDRLRGLCRGIQASEPRAKITCRISTQYRNMGYWLKDDMTPVHLADEAIRTLGLEPLDTPTRGGTDGSRLTERGLPTPNLFCGGHNAHGPLEWVAVQDMEASVKMCVELARLWERKGTGYKGYTLKKKRGQR
jgi:tripeptide aminopeptidase